MINLWLENDGWSIHGSEFGIKAEICQLEWKFVNYCWFLWQFKSQEKQLSSSLKRLLCRMVFCQKFSSIKWRLNEIGHVIGKFTLRLIVAHVDCTQNKNIYFIGSSEINAYHWRIKVRYHWQVKWYCISSYVSDTIYIFTVFLTILGLISFRKGFKCSFLVKTLCLEC